MESHAMKRIHRLTLLVLLSLVMISGCLPLPNRPEPPGILATAPPLGSPVASDGIVPASAALRAPTQPSQVAPPPPPREQVLAQVQLFPPAPLPSGSGQASLPAPPLELTDLPLPINLATALRLADARPLVVAAAQASAWVAEAQLQQAKLIWVPELDLDVVYFRHDGYGPDFNRGSTVPFDLNSTRLPISQNLNYFYAGGGLYTVFAVTDAIFQPLAARQVLDSRRWDIQAAKNDALLLTAQSYFDVHRYRGMYAGALDTVQRGRQLVERIRLLSEELVTKAEVNRAQRQLADLEQRAVSAREQWRVASADLTQVLRLDPRAVVVPVEHDHLQITLIDPARPLDNLMPIGLANRPELKAQQALIQAAQVRIRQEKLRPFIPSVIITGFQTPGDMRMQFGFFGTGSDSSMNLWSLRDDISTQLVWQAEGLGFGNLARVKERRGEESRAMVDLNRVQDMVAADVTQAQANLQSAAVRVSQAERSLREARITFEKNYEGLRQTTRFENVLIQAYRPQEAVVALARLRDAYDEYFGTVADYNQAQFRLFHALGYPAQGISSLQPPGEVVPVDTTRPGYLPAVGVGPPPATR